MFVAIQVSLWLLMFAPGRTRTRTQWNGTRTRKAPPRPLATDRVS